ncbi:hypothetical protein HMF8227_01174 [Saliniradius amylolyticus]|uniref:BioF2-like acetyltransferase domain-containing protein n=1 Tax=Saliniradius amylolyticus TaxID=2183582 RepID=A0A2S2E1Y0_9ALTE|nr:GNAT family N-acetyltransferase [Saliniradius amylolyticus]AWL11655.1 hypothetical protein HMF8227_01174 [Saliniradius amylolyticus]
MHDLLETAHYRCALITEWQELEQHEHAWQTLAKEYGKDGWFSSPQWLRPWYECFWQSDWSLLAVLVWNHRRDLVALLPLYTQPSYLGARVLRPLGQGEPEEAEIASEYTDALVHPAHGSELMMILERAVCALPFDWCYWRALSEKAGWLSVVARQPRVQFRPLGLRYMSLAGSPPSMSLERQYRRRLRKLQNQGAHCRWLARSEMTDYWSSLKQLHQKRWHQRGKTGAFISGAFNAFHQRQMQTSKRLKMSVLESPECIYGIHCYYEYQGRLFFYQSGWDPAFSAMSPGLVLHLWSRKSHSDWDYDLMLGSMNDSYKAKLADSMGLIGEVLWIRHPLRYASARVLSRVLMFLGNS